MAIFINKQTFIVFLKQKLRIDSKIASLFGLKYTKNN